MVDTRNDKQMVEMAECPSCHAICDVGSDEDFQVFCAKCKRSFKLRVTRLVTKNEHKQIEMEAYVTHKYSGWTAYCMRK